MILYPYMNAALVYHSKNQDGMNESHTYMSVTPGSPLLCLILSFSPPPFRFLGAGLGSRLVLYDLHNL